MRIEPGRGFIEEEQFGVANERRCDREPLPLAAREFIDIGAGFFLQTHGGDGFIGRGAARVERAKQRDGFLNRELIGQTRFLERDADLAADFGVVLAPLHAEDFHLAGSRIEQPLDDLERRRFPRAIGTEEAEALAGRHIEIETAHRFNRRPARIGLYEAANADGMGHGRIVGIV